MEKKNSANFRDYYMDDANVSPGMRAEIEFEVERIGKKIEAGEVKGLTPKQLRVESVLENG